MKVYNESELRELKTVFGEDVKFDKDGRPIEQGIGGPLQPEPFPTERPSVAPRPEQLDYLGKLVASVGSEQLLHDFSAFMAFRKAHPADCILQMPVELLTNWSGHPGIDPEKVRIFRGRLRNGDIAPPITVRDKNPQTGLYEIVEGHNRAAAARDESRKFVRAIIVKEADPRQDRGRKHNEESESF